jgi:flagellar hook assembly protein FlgD
MSITSVGASANEIRNDFMKLLVTQLQNQNPLEPMDNQQMATQLAQLSTLEQLENMNTTFQKVLASQEQTQAMELIGKEVDFFPEGMTELCRGEVAAVNVYDEGIRLVVGDYLVAPGQVQAIRD